MIPFTVGSPWHLAFAALLSDSQLYPTLRAERRAVFLLLLLVPSRTLLPCTCRLLWDMSPAILQLSVCLFLFLWILGPHITFIDFYITDQSSTFLLSKAIFFALASTVPIAIITFQSQLHTFCWLSPPFFMPCFLFLLFWQFFMLCRGPKRSPYTFTSFFTCACFL